MPGNRPHPNQRQRRPRTQAREPRYDFPAPPDEERPQTAAEKRRERELNRQKKALRKRVSGKPSYSGQILSLTQLVGRALLTALKFLLIILLLFGALGMGIGSGMLSGYFSTAQEVEVQDLSANAGETRILGANGEVLATLSSTMANSEFVPIEEIQKSKIADAFIAIEDERFETHPGIDFRRIGSAVISAIANAGSPTHGGSTITQQTIKMISGKNQLSAQRKIQEWYNAVRLEQRRSKANILELYLNLVPMANNYVGVGAASKAYFNKPVSELTIAEAAYLAGIPNRPATYNPLTEFGRRNSLRRQRFILNKMLELDKISEAEYEQALNEELVFDFSYALDDTQEIQSYAVDYIIERVQQDLVERLGYSPELANIAIYNYGLTIESTVDLDVQERLEEVFKTRSLFVTDESLLPDSPEEPEASITVLDNDPDHWGEIRGIVGGYGEKKSNFTLNRAVYTHRQPGSSIKPILVYGPALDAGKISMATPFVDREVFLDPDRPDTPYPLNYDRKYFGPQTLESAIVNSLNTIAADTYVNILGPEMGLSYLKQSGIDRTDEPYVSGALGGFSQGMSTYEMAEAFSVFAYDGNHVEPKIYVRVLNNDGSVLLDNSEINPLRVYQSETAGVMTHILKAVSDASHNNATPDNTPAAGKTGTTDSFTDVWFCGYTPYYTAAVWYGYDNANGRHTEIPLEDSKNAVKIWRAAMQSLHEDLPRREFTYADDLEVSHVCTVSGQLASPHCPSTMSVYLIPGSAANPTGTCAMHENPKSDEPKDENRYTFPWDKDNDHDEWWKPKDDHRYPWENQNQDQDNDWWRNPNRND